MLHPSTQKLIDRLAAMTARQELAWEESESGNPEYTTEGYTVVVMSEPSELRIRSEDGKEVERATPEQLLATSSESGETYSDILANMRIAALRKARGTETAISTLLNKLEEQDRPAEPAVSETPDEAEMAENEPSELDVTPEDVAAGAAPESLETDETSIALDAAIEDAPEPDAEEEPEPALTEEEASMTAAVARLADEVRERGNWATDTELPETSTDTDNAISVPDDAPDQDEDDMVAVTADPSVTLAEAETGPSGEDTPDTRAAAAPSEDMSAEFAYVPFGLAPVGNTETESTEFASAESADEDGVDEDLPTSLPTAAEPEPALTSYRRDEETGTEDLDPAPDAVASDTDGVLPPVAETGHVIANDDEPEARSGTALSGPAASIGLSGLGAGLYSREEDASGDSLEADTHDDSEGPVEETTRIVIDATDDVLDFIPSEPDEEEDRGEPETVAESPVSISAETVEEENEADSKAGEEEAEVRQFRPRFNPWS